MKWLRFWRACPVIACAFLATGCDLIALTILGLGSGQRAVDAGQCKSAGCDPDNWFVPEFSSFTYAAVSFYWGRGCPDSYRFDFVNDGDSLIAASLNGADSLLVAVAAENGDVFVADFGSSTARASASLNALGLAWSNAGDRLAVATRDPDSGSATLLILDEELVELARYDIAPVDSDAANLPRAAVSWSADDARVAVSGNAGPGLSIVSLSDGTQQRGEFFNAYFVGTDKLVASAPGLFGDSVRVIMLRQDGLQIGKIIDDALRVLASHPPTGVFIAEVTVRSFESANVGIRTIDVGPAVQWVYFNDLVFSLTPLDEALPTLEATGYGPDTPPQPDLNGNCPE